MDPIVARALVGTARHGQTNIATGLAVDELIEELPEGEAERKLLLEAGAWAVYIQAGQRPQQVAFEHEPARPETLRVCPPAFEHMLERLLNGEHADVLSEALTHMRAQGMHIPHSLLPLALNKASKELRPALFPVLGERGLWLSNFNSAWRWVREFLPAHESSLPADAETVWQEGSAGQRVEVLRRLRAVDPGQAREWLADCWKKERAEARADFLRTLEIGLNNEDEAFLEKALDDRAQSVRAVAANLLPHLPESAFCARMNARGLSILRVNNGTLEIVPPKTSEKDWLRDGITDDAPSKLGKRAWWLIQLLACIPPTFWEQQLGLEPAELLRQASATQWASNVIDGWSKAAVTYKARNWAVPLWHWWQENYEHLKREQITDYNLRENLLLSLPQEDAERIMLSLLDRPNNDETWETYLPHLPTPWSESFGRTFLQYLQKHLADTIHPQMDIKNFNPYANSWFRSLSVTAQALPRICLDEATLSLDFPPEETGWSLDYARREIHEFTEAIQIRQKIYEEII